MNTIDYSRKDNWFKIPEITKDIDTFFIYPTEYLASGEDEPDYAVIDNAEMLDGDYTFYYNNIKENVAKRIAAYQSSAK